MVAGPRAASERFAAKAAADLFFVLVLLEWETAEVLELPSVLSCGSVCRSCVTVTARPASTHTALVSQSVVGRKTVFRAFAFLFILCVYVDIPLWTGWPATTTPGIATRRFPPAVILCELCVLICQQHT